MLKSLFWSVLVGVFVAPLVVLSWYNVPSAADDFCFALNTLKFGFWQGQQYYYDGWSGRYFSTFLVHANPLVWEWLTWYKIFPIVALSLLAHSLFQLLKALNHNTQQSFVMVCGFLFLYLFALPSIAESFFWYPSVVGYPLPLALINYWLLAWIQYPTKPNRLKPLYLCWICFLIFAIVGSNETPMLISFILFSAILGFNMMGQSLRTQLKRGGLQWKLQKEIVISIFIFIVSLYLELSAPGNAERMKYNSQSQQVVASAISSIHDTIIWGIKWSLNTPLLVVTLLFIGQLNKLQWNEPIFKLHPFWGLLLWSIIVSISIFPAYYGIGIPPTPRTLNLTYWFFLLGWFFNCILIVKWFQNRGITSQPLLKYVHWAALLIIVISIKWSTTIRPLYYDLIRGNAVQYHHDMITRLELIKQHKNTDIILVDSLSKYPQTLFTEDITTNPTHLWNTCQSEYWGVKSIKLK
jgi:hypothetical protein